ncbi:hypothetical protein ECANGB1_1642 [Enterospora canceri]|uniref:Fork-head domain-containing protein n=1 Tax=Enterospora canceri TaxID=1081671 RepID=A0A1Y1SAA7_9MICR|nr:hypothetical protein ECANGB1_1642 [Enterospora canceri]
MRKQKIFKPFTYFELIKDAIAHYEQCHATSSEVFAYATAKYPHIFLQSNSVTWKNNIRQVLSKHPEFIKIATTRNNKKTNCWKFIELDEIRHNEKVLMKYLAQDDESKENISDLFYL